MPKSTLRCIWFLIFDYSKALEIANATFKMIYPLDVSCFPFCCLIMDGRKAQAFQYLRS